MPTKDGQGQGKANQYGAVSVEFMLVFPLFALMLLGALHFGRVITTRHVVTGATNYAVRAAVIRRTPASPQVEALLRERLGTDVSQCASIAVTAILADAGADQTALQVNVRCDLPPPIGSELLGAVGPGFVTVSVALPYVL